MANVLGTLFQDIADAIREKTGESGSMKPADFPAEILSIVTGAVGEEGDSPSTGESSGTVSGATSKLMRYKSGNFYPSSGRAIIQHGLGVEPDMILVTNAKCGYGYGVIINSLGFSRQVLDAFPDLKAHSWFCFDNYDEQTDTAPFILDNVHREPMDEVTDKAIEGGFICGVTASNFVIGNPSYPKLMTEYTDGERACYSWIAVSGLLNVVTTTEGTCKMIFRDRGESILYERLVFTGDDCPDPVAQGKLATPTRASTVSHHYTFSGWSEQNGGSAADSALAAVHESRTVYAAYAATVRQYTVRFFDGETLLSSAQVNYNAYATPPDTAREGLIFVGWDRDPATTPITGDTDFYGTWQIDEGWLAYRGTLTGLTGTNSSSNVSDANYVYDIRYTPDGTRMVAATNSNLYLYDATTTPYTLLTTKSTGTSYLQTGIDISPDGKELALCLKNKSTSVSNSLKFYSLTDDALTYKSSASGTLGTSSVLYAPRYSHDGTKVAVWANESKGVAVFERSGSWTLAADIATTRNIYLYNDIYRIDLAFSPDDTVLSAVCGYSYQYVAHTLFDMTSYTDITGTKSVSYISSKYRVAYHPSGDYLLIGGEEMHNYKAIFKVTLSGEGTANERTYSSTSFNPTVFYNADISGMEFSPTGKVILLTHLGGNPTLHGYLADTWEKLETPSTLPDGNGRSLAISPDGKVAVGTEGGKVFTYRLHE